MKNYITVLCVLDYYLPGYKGGGPVTTIANMISGLKKEAEVFVFTRNHDLGSIEKYNNVKTNAWNLTEHGIVFYASKSEFNYRGLKSAISTINKKFDLLYLNSFFGYYSSIQMNLRFLRIHPNIPILIAPRGEFSIGALSIKALRKKAFILLARSLNLYSKVNWQASSAYELEDIKSQFPDSARNIYIAEDPINIRAIPCLPILHGPSPSGQLRLVFISRISPMKNLVYLLSNLAKVKRQVNFSIYGPIEDETYWKTCKSIINSMPSNINVSYHNPLVPSSVLGTFGKYDLFAFPTLGENFGHVIFEALCAGTPVLISDRTPWKADITKAISVITLDDKEKWVRALEIAADRTEKEKNLLRLAARSFAENFVKATKITEKNLAMFHEVIQKNQHSNDDQATKK